MCSFIGGVLHNENRDLYIKTINPALGEYFNKNSDVWKGTLYNGKRRDKTEKVKDSIYKNRFERLSYCHKYVGEKIQGYEDLLLPIEIMRDRKIKSQMYSLFEGVQ